MDDDIDFADEGSGVLGRTLGGVTGKKIKACLRM
jgi:hypothetical protein